MPALPAVSQGDQTPKRIPHLQTLVNPEHRMVPGCTLLAAGVVCATARSRISRGANHQVTGEHPSTHARYMLCGCLSSCALRR